MNVLLFKIRIPGYKILCRININWLRNNFFLPTRYFLDCNYYVICCIYYCLIKIFFHLGKYHKTLYAVFIGTLFIHITLHILLPAVVFIVSEYRACKDASSCHCSVHNVYIQFVVIIGI